METKRIKLIFRRGSLPLKVAVLMLLTVSLLSLLVVWLYKQDAKNDYDSLRQQAIMLEQENSRLQRTIDSVGTLEGIFQIAREELGLVDPDSVVIQPAP